ncbi:MAG TPA: methyltransferase [Longimicrobiales bacterium]|nr:methyltransferase [Longimicrobiales bacterium]
MLKVVSNLALLVVVSALLALAVGGSLFSASPYLVATQVMAVGLAVWARRSFPSGAFRATAPPSGDAVIRTGPYRLVRHPMYSAALLLTWSGVVTHLSLWSAAIGVVATAAVAARIVVEERLLRERYADYRAYAGVTKALIPFVA